MVILGNKYRKINPHYCSSKDKPSKSIPSFKVNDKVLCLNISQGPKWVQGTIVEKLGVNVFHVHIHDFNVIWKRHSYQILLRNVSNDDDSLNPYLGSEHSRFGTCFEPASGACSESESSDFIQPVPLRRSKRIRRPPVCYGFEE